MTKQEANKIFQEQAQRIADFWIAGSDLITNDEKITFLHDIANETSKSPFTVSVLLSKVRSLVTDDVYYSVYPKPIIK